MSHDTKSVGAVGLIRVGDLEITVTPLSQIEELALDRQLRRGAEAEAGDHYTRCRAELDAMRDFPGDRLEFLREIARATLRKEPLSPAAVYEFRCSAAGVALELFARGRKATPGLALAGLRAVVTMENADQIAAALFELIEGGDPKATR